MSNFSIIRDARVVDVYNPMPVTAPNRKGAIGLRFRIAEGQGKSTIFRTVVAWDNLPPVDQATPKSGPNLASYLNKHIGKGASISFVGIETPRGTKPTTGGGGGYGGRGGTQQQSNETELKIQGGVSIHAHSGEQALMRAIRREVVTNPNGDLSGALAAFISTANQERTGRALAIPEAWPHLTEVEQAYVDERAGANNTQDDDNVQDEDDTPNTPDTTTGDDEDVPF